MSPIKDKVIVFFNKYKFDCICIFTAFIILCLEFFFFLKASYWEGLGKIPFGTWFLVTILGYLIGLIFFVIFVLLLIVKFKKSSIKISLLRLLFALLIPLSFHLNFIVTTQIGEPGALSFLRGFRERINNRCDPLKMREWAESFLRNNLKKDKYFKLEGEQIPYFVKQIHPDEAYGKVVRVFIEEKDSEEYIYLFWGSALTGHWGIEIGPENLSLESNQNQYRLKWKPGLYVTYQIE